MPVSFISGPAGLSQEAKGTLIRSVLHALVAAYQMPDDRVFITEFPVTDTGHTGQEGMETFLVQSRPARPVCRIDAPPGLPLDQRRKLMQEITEAIAQAYRITDLRDVLIFLQEYPIALVANNGYLQHENPAFASPVTM